MDNNLRKINKGGVLSSEGWSIQVTHPEILEYRISNTVIVVNLDYDPNTRTVNVYATEAQSDQCPNLKNHIQSAVSLLKGSFRVL